MDWKLSPVCPQPLLHLLSVNKGEEAQLERANFALTSTHHFGSLMLLAAGRRSLQGCLGLFQAQKSKLEVPGLEENRGIFYFSLLSSPLLKPAVCISQSQPHDMALHGKVSTCR